MGVKADMMCCMETDSTSSILNSPHGLYTEYEDY